MLDLSAYLHPVNLSVIGENSFPDTQQIGNCIHVPSADAIALEQADIVLIGCGEFRGKTKSEEYHFGTYKVRTALYEMYHWHQSVRLMDVGDIISGNSYEDTLSALNYVLTEIQDAGKIAIVIGGSHDLATAQYEVFKLLQQSIDWANVDMKIDISDEDSAPNQQFLLKLLTDESNYLRAYSHIGFQSYYVNPTILQALDKLRFDFFRLGHVRSDIESMEPILRDANMMTIDMNVVRNSDAHYDKRTSPNGFFGDEICYLMKFAGMSKGLTSIGIYEYLDEADQMNVGATLIAQMIWYFIEGVSIRHIEADVEMDISFDIFQVKIAGVNTQFLKSKKTNRWWMSLPEGQYIPCLYKDYQAALNNDVPERWIRAQERLM